MSNELKKFYKGRAKKPDLFNYDDNGNLVELNTKGETIKTIALPEYRPITQDEINEMETKRMEAIAIASNDFDEARNRLYDEFKKIDYNDSTIFRLNREVALADAKLQAIKFPDTAYELEDKIEIRKLDFTQLNEKRKFPGSVLFYKTSPFHVTDLYVRAGKLDKPLISLNEINEIKEKQEIPVILFAEPATNDYGFLSLNWVVAIQYNSTTYHSAKQAIFAEIAKQFNDQENLKKIMSAETPEEITYSVEDIPGDKEINELRWNDIIRKLLYDINIIKFNSYPELKERLLQTQSANLGAYLPNENLLGIGLSLDKIDSLNPIKWTGQNLLGKALMDIRTKIQSEVAVPVIVKPTRKPRTSTTTAATAATTATATTANSSSGTKVVSCKVSDIRPGSNNLKEWMEKPNHVYIARKGVVFIDGKRFPNQDSIWANPYKIGPDMTREQVIEKYKEYITNRLNTEPALKDELMKLNGKELGCWCSPEPCHGDVLLELINTYSKPSIINSVTSAVSTAFKSFTTAILPSAQPAQSTQPAVSSQPAVFSQPAVSAQPAQSAVSSQPAVSAVRRKPRVASFNPLMPQTPTPNSTI